MPMRITVRASAGSTPGSVFNECYVGDRAQREPRPVKVCAEPAVPYTGN